MGALGRSHTTKSWPRPRHPRVPTARHPEPPSWPNQRRSSFPASSSSGAGAVELNLKSAATNVTRYSVNNNPYGYPAIWNPDW